MQGVRCTAMLSVLILTITGCGGLPSATPIAAPTVSESALSSPMPSAIPTNSPTPAAVEPSPLTVQPDPTVILSSPAPTPLPPSPTAALPVDLDRDIENALAQYEPDIAALLLRNGYEANIITVGDRRGLRASQLSYATSVWSRDLDYAISGYSYVLGDMDVLRENIELFLMRVDPDGVAPETIYIRGDRLDYENRQAWDSMPNLIHATYVYVSKTGDRDFYRANRDILLRVGARIVAMDRDGDGLPDGDDFPYGYYDSLYNSVMHTYAIAKFYAAYNELAELEATIGMDGDDWARHAGKLRESFHRSFDAGGYWLNDQTWPIAWKQADGAVVNILETFGIFSALRAGLIAPRDGERYADLVATMHAKLPDLIDTPTPMRLALGGYEPEMRREVDPPVPLWMLDASAPWIVGLATPAYAAAGYAEDARTLIQAYETMARNTDPPVLEFAAGPSARYGPGDSGDGGRTWDSAAWFLAVYGGHYGLTMTPAALVVQPAPFVTLPADGIAGFSYQGAVIRFELDAARSTYLLESDRHIVARLLPISGMQAIRVNDGPARGEETLTLQPGQRYKVVSQSELPASELGGSGVTPEP